MSRNSHAASACSGEAASRGGAGGEGKLLSIGQLAAVAGVSSRTIRYYEELGILPAPPRSSAGTRKYPPEWSHYLKGALALKEIGFSLEEIRLLGRLLFGGKMSKTDRKQAAAAIAEKTLALEQKMQVLTRLGDVLRDVEEGHERGPGAVGEALGLPVTC